MAEQYILLSSRLDSAMSSYPRWCVEVTKQDLLIVTTWMEHGILVVHMKMLEFSATILVVGETNLSIAITIGFSQSKSWYNDQNQLTKYLYL